MLLKQREPPRLTDESLDFYLKVKIMCWQDSSARRLAGPHLYPGPYCTCGRPSNPTCSSASVGMWSDMVPALYCM